jgi:hypothetical protein
MLLQAMRLDEDTLRDSLRRWQGQGNFFLHPYKTVYYFPLLPPEGGGGSAPSRACLFMSSWFVVCDIFRLASLSDAILPETASRMGDCLLDICDHSTTMQVAMEWQRLLLSQDLETK